MDLIGYIANITFAVTNIDYGRKGFAVKEKADEGRVAFEKGIEIALSTFKEAQISADPQALILAEYTFITQEFHFCEKSDTDTINSLAKAVESFDGAFLALTIVEDSAAYQNADKTYPRNDKYRIKGFPLDSFHIACNSHKTQIKNMLRTPGVDPIEKDLLKQRLANLYTAQNSYIEKQKKTMEN